MTRPLLDRKKKRKFKRRVILGVGYPWFDATGVTYDSVKLTKKRGGADCVEFKFFNVGNWNKCRLVLEVIE